ncbi:DsbA family protein [Spectribacter hydrogenoxidans]|uniref:DsbA family protein n=1 Tax=Spectribacter hydrogenoxidans TaxID=3075608 RepID=A0ABU3C328_9GAMM|nr:DsbA family protein [Salinisphaera sp. W335]MDT0635958.1 DsbA family protein [Salinisphaera sp. W335]
MRLMRTVQVTVTRLARHSGVAIVTPMCLFASAAHAETALGSADAPVTLVEYGSLTCDHCVRFHREVLPDIKSRYIDTGRLRFVYRNFPTSAAALRGAVAARCAGDQYYQMLDALYASVRDWARQDDVDSALVQQAAAIGLNQKSFGACLDAPRHKRAITREQRRASREHGVLGTPTFLINGEVVPGKKNIDEMQDLIEWALPDSTVQYQQH